MEVIKTHTGKIYVDTERKLEFLTVGDYGKENNIKAEFLGLKTEINGVKHHDVDLKDKWVATISTQKGCPMRCQFCDCPKFGFFGNASREDLYYQIETLLTNESTKETNRFNVHYARMGEPTFNPNVLDFTKNCLLSQKRKARLVYNQNLAIFNDFWQRRAQTYLTYFKREFAGKRENIDVLASSNTITCG